MLTRRKFIELTAIWGALLPASAQASWFIPYKSFTFQGGWENWNEKHEGTLASDSIYVCMAENPNASGNETGQGGGLSGADLVLTQSGSIAGATGSPPRRAFDGSDDHFLPTQNWCDGLFSGSTWSFIAKITIDAVGVYHGLLYLGDTAWPSNNFIQVHITDANQLYLRVIENGTDYSVSTTDTVSNGSTYYFAVWADGVNKVRCGFSTTKPTSWASFEANKRKEISTNMGDFTGVSWAEYKYVLGSDAGTHMPEISAYYVVAANTCLLA